MTKENDQPPVPMQQMPDYYQEQEDEINLLDLLQVIFNRKKMIISITFLAIIASVVYSLNLPETFTATARILPPKDSKSGGLSSLLGAAGGIAGLVGAGGGSADLYVGIMKSRTVADALIKQFNLKELYEADFMSNVYKQLSDQTTIDVSRKDQIISISVEDENPELAAQIANAYIDHLDQLNQTVNITEAHRKRVFLEKRIKKVAEDLANAEIVLKEFQEKYKIVSIADQARISMEGAARIKGDIISAQTKLEVLKEFGTEKQNEAVMLRSQINELQRQLEKIERGNNDGNINEQKNGNSDFYIPFNQLPSLGLKLTRLMREAKVQEKVFELLTSQFEMAKIEEAKDVNTIQVLDKAIPPDRKSGPKKRQIVMLSTVVAFFLSIFLSFIFEYIGNLKTQDKERYQKIKNSIFFRPRK